MWNYQENIRWKRDPTEYRSRRRICHARIEQSYGRATRTWPRTRVPGTPEATVGERFSSTGPTDPRLSGAPPGISRSRPPPPPPARRWSKRRGVLATASSSSAPPLRSPCPPRTAVILGFRPSERRSETLIIRETGREAEDGPGDGDLMERGKSSGAKPEGCLKVSQHPYNDRWPNCPKYRMTWVHVACVQGKDRRKLFFVLPILRTCEEHEWNLYILFFTLQSTQTNKMLYILFFKKYDT